MKFMHIGDLHVGKRVNEFNLIEDQKYILDQILKLVEQYRPDGVLIAGDIYDKPQPSAEAVELLDEFFTSLTKRSLAVFVISGNHDSPERLGFGNRILREEGLHIAGVFDGVVRKEILEDSLGTVNLYLLPFLKPAMVRPFTEQPVETYEDAVREALRSAAIDPKQRNILVAHQFVTAAGRQPERSDSEVIALGGVDQVDYSLFEAFDYVALGHLHGPQRVGRDTVRYAGSPLKYSFSEARQKKSVTLVELKEKGQVEFQLIPLVPLRELREIRGPLAELLKIGREEGQASEDYLHATLTDPGEVYDAVGQLRTVYPNLMALDFDRTANAGAERNREQAMVSEPREKSPLELFEQFYQLQNDQELSGEERKLMETVLNGWEGGAL